MMRFMKEMGVRMMTVKYLIKTPSSVFAFSADEKEKFLKDAERIMKEEGGKGPITLVNDASSFFAQFAELEAFQNRISDSLSFDAELTKRGPNSFAITIPAKVVKEYDMFYRQKVKVVLLDPDDPGFYVYV